MNSQIYENDGDDEFVEKLWQSTGRILASLKRQEAKLAARRRSLAEPTHKLVVATPTSMHHKITLGAVLVGEAFQASDADALAGLLTIDAADFAERFSEALEQKSNGRVSDMIAHIIDTDARELSARGLFVEWQRRLALYRQDCAEWFARDDELRHLGEWRNAEMTADQRWLMRVTCRVLNRGLPGHLSRGEAADWLEANGANLNYRDFT